MGTNESPRNRGVNVAVQFDLADFTQRFFALFGAEASFTGPGPLYIDSATVDCDTASERFAVVHQAKEMYSKYDDGVKTDAKREAAIRKFNEAELICALTNCKFQHTPTGQVPAWLDPVYGGWTPELEVDAAVFMRARSIISRILGPFPGWEAVLMHADFGPGATTRLSRASSHRSNKWGDSPHVGLKASSLMPGFLEALPLISRRVRQHRPWHTCVQGNKLDWVPKNYKTDRTIAIEPDLSMFLQKGIGQLVRKRLKRVKQDLDNQETNQFLAAVGSIDGSLATLDLSMASDMVSYNLARYLIRPDWFEAIDCLRSPIGFYSHDGVDVAHVYEKLSSMGNGKTFETESLIFYGILRAVSELSEQSDHRVYVYGDDIVVPTGMADLAMTYLNKAGFIVNREKSFWDGPFRESCGGHYYSGTDVTPFYVREQVDLLDRLFLLHNNCYRWFNRHPYILEPEKVSSFLSWIRSHAPVDWQRPRLMTEDVGDGAFIGPFDAVCPEPAGKRAKRQGWEGWRVETLQYRDKKERSNRSKEKPARHPWGAFKPPVVRRHSKLSEDLYDFSDKQDAVLSALWSLEGNEMRYANMRQRRDAVDIRTISAKDWEIIPKCFNRDPKSFCDWLFPTGSRSQDLPHAERWWYVAVQVLPFSSGVSWW